MADFTVDTGGTLESRLTRNGIQAWRAPVLIASNAVKVWRNKAFITVTGPTMKVESGDVIRIADPLPPGAIKALQAAADKNASDYAFVPGTSPFDLKMAGVLDNRPRTIRIKDPLVDSLKGFIAALSKNRAITAPIRDVIIASHANPEGFLFMKLDLLGAGEITYEDLEAAVKAKSLVIDSAWLEPRPRDASATAIPARFLVRGCRIGTPFPKLKDQHPYLTKLKQALGNKVPVFAPKHFHVGAEQSAPAGFVEYMSYSFPLRRPKRIANQALVIKAFQNGGFTRIDGKPVPAKLWAGWVPPNPHAKYEQKVDATVLNPITNARDTIPGRFRFKDRNLYDTEQSMALAKDPKSEAGRKAAVQKELESTHPQYQTTHAFPAYARLGYDSMAEFMDGFHWKFRYDAKSGTLFFKASRAEYTVIQPITEITTNKLILNYYPSGPKGKVLELLDVTNTDFFATV
jgi:hypothetical protein